MSKQRTYPYTGSIPGSNNNGNEKVLVWIQSPGRGYLLNVEHNVEITVNEENVTPCLVKCTRWIGLPKTSPETVTEEQTPNGGQDPDA